MRKVPVSMPLLRGLLDRLDRSQWDDLVIAAAVMTMFMFGLRSGEALRSKAKPDEEKCLRASMVVFRRNQEVVTGASIEDADEVVLVMGRSKADPQGQGSVSNLHESKLEDLCAVKLIKEMYRRRPELSTSKEAFLFTLDGRVLSAARVSRLLKDQGELAGYPRDSLSVISLREGFASVSHNEGVPVEQIMTTGKWRSNCFRHYIWGGQEVDNQRGSKMLSSRYAPLAAQRKFQRDQDRREMNGHPGRKKRDGQRETKARFSKVKAGNGAKNELSGYMEEAQEESRKRRREEGAEQLREAKLWAARQRKWKAELQLYE
jgi:hypothetical protein